MSACKCGYEHARLSVEIADRVLFRSATRAHRVKAFSGAWGFSAQFWDHHRTDFDAVQIAERDTGIVWHATAAAFDRAALRSTLSAAFGPQVILPLREWKRLDETGAGDGAGLAESAGAVQLLLIPSREMQGTHYEKAKQPRPRIFRSKKWDRAA